MELIKTIAPYMKKYVVLEGLTGEVYKKTLGKEKDKIWKTVKHEELLPRFRKNISICYAFFPVDVDLQDLKESDLLYIGSGMGCARYWYGNSLDGTKLKGRNFHHSPSRKKGNLERYLIESGPVAIHVITGYTVEELHVAGIINVRLELADSYPRINPVNKHFGKVLEQEILVEKTARSWSWNTAQADLKFRPLFA